MYSSIIIFASRMSTGLCGLMHSVFRIEKKFSAGELSSGLPALDIEGKMLYSLVRVLYAVEVY